MRFASKKSTIKCTIIAKEFYMPIVTKDVIERLIKAYNINKIEDLPKKTGIPLNTWKSWKVKKNINIKKIDAICISAGFDFIEILTGRKEKSECDNCKSLQAKLDYATQLFEKLCEKKHILKRKWIKKLKPLHIKGGDAVVPGKTRSPQPTTTP